MRAKPSEALSEAGRALAREVGQSAGPFELVISSPLGRATETTEEMGLKVTRTDPLWAELSSALDKEVAWPAPFTAYWTALRLRETTRELFQLLRKSIAGTLAELRGADRALIVTHGGVPELVAVGYAITRDPQSWGGPLRCLEGVRIGFDRETAEVVEVLRVADTKTRL